MGDRLGTARQPKEPQEDWREREKEMQMGKR